MRLVLSAVFAAALLPVLAAGQKLDLNLDAIAARASEKAEVDLDGAALAAGLKIAGQSMPKEARVLPEGITALRVRAYEFANAGAYTLKDLEPLRRQLGPGSGWSRIVNVKEKHETTEIYLFKQSEAVKGLVVLAAEEKELAVVYFAGSVALDKVAGLVNSSMHFDLAKLMKAE